MDNNIRSANIAAVAHIISGALRLINYLQQHNVHKDKLKTLINKAIDEERDVGADEIQALFEDAQKEIDGLKESIGQKAQDAVDNSKENA